MIDYRRHRWVPITIAMIWFAWLFAISRIGLAGLTRVGGDIWIRLIWILVLAIIAFGLPLFLLLRFAKRHNRAR